MTSAKALGPAKCWILVLVRRPYIDFEAFLRRPFPVRVDSALSLDHLPLFNTKYHNSDIQDAGIVIGKCFGLLLEFKGLLFCNTIPSR